MLVVRTAAYSKCLKSKGKPMIARETAKTSTSSGNHSLVNKGENWASLFMMRKK